MSHCWLLLPWQRAVCKWCMGCSGSSALPLILHEGMTPGNVYLLWCCRVLLTQDAPRLCSLPFLHASRNSFEWALPLHVLSASEGQIHCLGKSTKKRLPPVSAAWSTMTLSAMACMIPAVRFQSCSHPQRVGSFQV